MDYAGDWATEYDYSNQEWFTGPPPPTQPEHHTPKAAYIPEPLVIERNDMFVYALKAAPAVLYERYKQYGQLGVLAWCSEFGDMIDELKVFLEQMGTCSPRQERRRSTHVANCLHY